MISGKSGESDKRRLYRGQVINRGQGNMSIYTADLYLVSCVSRKGSAPAPAKDLYQSDWFSKARAWVQQTGRPWFILSAKYGLVHPAAVIAPYEKTLNKMPAAERRAWAAATIKQPEPHLDGVESVVFLAGQRYREHLALPLQSRGIAVSAPMAGLVIGRQLAWLKAGTHRETGAGAQ